MLNTAEFFTLIGLAGSARICKRVTEANEAFRACTTAWTIEMNTRSVSLLSNEVGN